MGLTRDFYYVEGKEIKNKGKKQAKREKKPFIANPWTLAGSSMLVLLRNSFQLQLQDNDERDKLK